MFVCVLCCCVGLLRFVALSLEMIEAGKVSTTKLQSVHEHIPGNDLIRTFQQNISNCFDFHFGFGFGFFVCYQFCSISQL